MPVIFTDKPAPYEYTPNRFRWTRRQCDSIRSSGFLTERYELIDGEILSKRGQNPPHRMAVVLVHAWLTAVFGALSVQTQATIDVADADPDHNEPEPDAAVTVEPNTFYTDRHPGPADLTLVCEVSDTTLRYDLNTKANLYSQAGIREYWVMDLTGRRLIVHRQPTPQGYQSVTAYAAEEEAATLARPDAPIQVAALLPPA